MKFRELELAGAFVVDLVRSSDERGAFARTVCSREFVEAGLPANFVQSSVSSNLRKGTLRGMHFQRPPCEEGKLVRCTSGAILDVLLDLRPGSATFLRWVGLELSRDNGRSVYIPPGLAHGFQTLADDCDVLYQMTEYFNADAGAGVRFDDPAFSIVWPLPVSIISARDATYPDYRR